MTYPETVEYQADPATSVNGESAEQEVSLLDILIYLRRHLRLLVVCPLVLAAVSFVYSCLLKKSYTAMTSFLPPQQNSSSSSLLSQLSGLGSLAGLAGGGAIKNPSDLYVGLMKSETVVNSMVRRFHLQNEFHEKLPSIARKRLEGMTKFDSSAKDGLIRVSVTTASPEHSAELANGWVEEYQHLSSSLALGEASQRRLFLEGQLTQVKNNLASSEEDLKRMEQTSGVVQLDSQARALIESVASLRAQISAKEVQVASLRSYSGEGNVELQTAEQELSSLRAQLTKLGGSESGQVGDMVVPQGKLPQLGLEYVRKTRDVKYNETLFEILARQFEAAKLDEAREGAVIQVVDKAYPPDYKSGPKRIFYLLGGFIIGLFIPLFWLLWRGLIRHLRKSPEVAQKLDALALGSRR